MLMTIESTLILSAAINSNGCVPVIVVPESPVAMQCSFPYRASESAIETTNTWSEEYGKTPLSVCAITLRVTVSPGDIFDFDKESTRHGGIT